MATATPLSEQTLFEPVNEVQDAFIWNTSRESVADGGIGNGKTSGGVERVIILASRFPGSRYVIFRQEYKMLMQTTRKTFERICPLKWEKSGPSPSNQYTSKLVNGSEIHWMHMDEADEKTLRSLEINGAFGDQIEEIHPEVWEILDSRIGRWQLPQWGRRCPPYIWGTSNPEGHDWVYYRFHPDVVKYPAVRTQLLQVRHPITGQMVDAQMMFAESPQKAYFFSDTLANIEKLNQIDPSYVRNLLMKPKSWQQKWVFGNRSVFEGMIHKDFKPNVHVYDAFDPFKDCQIKHIWGYFDYGLSSPTCLHLVATDKENFSFFFREYYEANRTISEHAMMMKKMIAEVEAKYMRVAGIYADPSVFYEDTRDRKNQSGRTSIAAEYASEGVYFIRADNNEDSSIERINEFLKVDPERMNPVTRTRSSPQVFFSKDCPYAVEQIQQQRWKKQRNALTGELEYIQERDADVPDHAYDPVRYWANARTDYTPFTGVIRKPLYGRPLHA